MKVLVIVNEKQIYKSNVPFACIGFSVCALHPSEFLSSTFKQFHALIPKPTASKITGKHGGNSDHLAKIPSEFISCPH